MHACMQCNAMHPLVKIRALRIYRTVQYRTVREGKERNGRGTYSLARRRLAGLSFQMMVMDLGERRAGRQAEPTKRHSCIKSRLLPAVHCDKLGKKKAWEKVDGVTIPEPAPIVVIPFYPLPLYPLPQTIACAVLYAATD